MAVRTKHIQQGRLCIDFNVASDSWILMAPEIKADFLVWGSQPVYSSFMLMFHIVTLF